VRIYPGTDHIEEYGGSISLDKWGAVLARGRDEFGHNKITTETLRGTPIRTVSAH
jgi:non-heme Fe2+,alpha-ketoglutarate-dependent halogenase